MPNFELHSHKQIIKHREVVDDDWSVLKLVEDGTRETVEVPAGKIIVPVKVWLAQREQLLGRAERRELGIWFASDELANTVKDDLDKFAVVAVDFPKFSDGRGYSIAYNLRMRLGYDGELRAIGDVLRDQMFYMQRVGFNAFATREDRSIHEALKGLFDFSEAYSAAWDQKQPLFRRVERGQIATQE